MEYQEKEEKQAKQKGRIAILKDYIENIDTTLTSMKYHLDELINEIN